MGKKGNDWQEETRGAVTKFDKAGDVVSGTYIRKETGVGKHKSNVYHFEDAKGEAVSFFGCAQIDAFMDTKEPGDVLKIEYTGKTTKTKAGFKVKLYKFFSK